MTQSMASNMPEPSMRKMFYLMFGGDQTNLPASLRNTKNSAKQLTWADAAKEMVSALTHPPLPILDGTTFDWSKLAMLGGDINWDQFGFYEWDCETLTLKVRLTPT